jgi:translation elongation factor P/translation initiation factor 5A
MILENVKIKNANDLGKNTQIDHSDNICKVDDTRDSQPPPKGENKPV